MNNHISTTILGPYDDLPTSEKIVLSASVPKPVRRDMFEAYLPRRGAIDKVICRALNTMHEYLEIHPMLSTISADDREFVMNGMLNKFAEVMTETEPASLLPEKTPELDFKPECTIPGDVTEIL